MRYVGGKHRIRKPIIEEINKLIKPDMTYLEPFCGSCAVGREVINVKKRIFNDDNFGLIRLYNAVVYDNYEPPKTLDKERYYYLKEIRYNNLDNEDDYNNYLEGIFASFFCSFGGKEWGGYAKGENRNFCLEAHNDLMKFKVDMKGALFYPYNYLELNNILDINNFIIYCDPPYQNTQKYKNQVINYDEFWETVRSWAKNNIVLVSERTLREPGKVLREFNLKTTLKRKNYVSNKEYLYLVE